MPLPRASLPAGTLAILLLSGCAGTPPPASVPAPGSPTGSLLPPGPLPVLPYAPPPGENTVSDLEPAGRDCDPRDPMAMDPGPRADSLPMRRVPGGWAAPMPNACPVDPRFQQEQPRRYESVRIQIRGRSSTPPKPR